MLNRYTHSRPNTALIARRSRGETALRTQVGFAELTKTADDRANIGGTIIGAPIIGQ